MKNVKPIKTSEDAISIAVEIVLATNVRGLRKDHQAELSSPEFDGRGLSLEFERADRAANCTLYVRMDPDWDSKTVLIDGVENRRWLFVPTVEVSWSGTSRNVAAALVNVELYTEVLKLAAEIEVALSSGTYGKDMPVSEEKAAS